MPYCYILKSLRSGRYYVGSTENFQKRFLLHNSGKIRSTKNDCPWRVILIENFHDFSEARKRELQIKKWKSRQAIEKVAGIKI